jgi:hypothetical protein
VVELWAKPHLRWQGDTWQCVGVAYVRYFGVQAFPRMVSGHGLTPQAAWKAWQSAARGWSLS